MSLSRRSVGVLLFVTVLLVPGTSSYAQSPAGPGSLSTWAVGVSPGLWNHVPTNEERHNGIAWDASLEHRVGNTRICAIRVQLGTGEGENAGEPGFNYNRLLLGVVRELSSASQAPFTVYVAGGGGAYVLTSPDGRRTRPSVYGGLGLDARLGRSPASIDAEIQVHTIGGALYGTTSLGLRIHLG